MLSNAGWNTLRSLYNSMIDVTALDSVCGSVGCNSACNCPLAFVEKLSDGRWVAASSLCGSSMTVTAFAIVDTNGLHSSDAIEAGTEGVLWGVQPEAWVQHKGEEVLLFSCSAQFMWVPNLYDSEGRKNERH